MLKELDWIASRARLYPNDPAVILSETDETFTYQEIDDRAARLSRFFIQEGIGKGDRVALLAPNDLSYFDFLFACMKAGAIFVPLNWRLSESDLTYVLEDCEPKLVGIHDEMLDDHAWMVDTYDSIQISSPIYIEKLSFSRSFDLQAVPLIETDPLAMVYTGGTTGKPKGAVLSHRSILWNGLNTIISWGLTKEDCTLTAIPMFHSGGLNALSTPVLLAGGTVVLQSKFEPVEAVRNLLNYQCSIVLFIPTMYHMITQTEIFQESDFPQMKVFLSGGAPCPLTIYERFIEKGLEFKEGYGLTEAGPNNFYIDPRIAKLKKGSVGKEMMFNQIRIADEEGEPVELGEVGELWLRGNHLFEFYWNDEEETETSITDGWLKTGDLARRDEDGFVYIIGRKKEMIISGGENIYPLEIEHWLQSHEAIDEVAVLGVPDEKWGEKVVAYVSLKEGELTEDDLEQYCAEKLSRYKIPKTFHIIDELPKTHVGKIDKNALLTAAE